MDFQIAEYWIVPSLVSIAGDFIIVILVELNTSVKSLWYMC